jgi:hypothetical protein
VSPGSRESVSGDDVCAGVGAGTATAQRFAITVEKESRSNSAADEDSLSPTYSPSDVTQILNEGAAIVNNSWQTLPRPESGNLSSILRQSVPMVSTIFLGLDFDTSDQHRRQIERHVDDNEHDPTESPQPTKTSPLQEEVQRHRHQHHTREHIQDRDPHTGSQNASCRKPQVVARSIRSNRPP